MREFLKQAEAARTGTGPLVFEITTEGGDAEGGRRIALEVRLLREAHGRETYFVGKSVVMSAGISIMAAFPRTHRYLTADATLLVHERRLQTKLDLIGPIKADIQIVREMLSQLQMAERVERDGFAQLARDSKLTTDELTRRATENCYLTAREALDLGLVEGII